MDSTARTMTACGAAALVGLAAGLALARQLTKRDRLGPSTPDRTSDPSRPSVVYLAGYIRGYEDGDSRALVELLPAPAGHPASYDRPLAGSRRQGAIRIRDITQRPPRDASERRGLAFAA